VASGGHTLHAFCVLMRRRLAPGTAAALSRLLAPAPVIVLSGRTRPGNKIAGLDAGADDYATKPLSIEELLARLRAVRRRGDTPPVRVPTGSREIDLAARAVHDGARAGWLTPTQWRLPEILLRRPGHLVGTRPLLTEIWDPGKSATRFACASIWQGPRRKLEAGRPGSATC
jgi:two-component system KDP operon response regulator KdpE